MVNLSNAYLPLHSQRDMLTLPCSSPAPQILIQHSQVYQHCAVGLSKGTGCIGKAGAGKEAIMHGPSFTGIREVPQNLGRLPLDQSGDHPASHWLTPHLHSPSRIACSRQLTATVSTWTWRLQCLPTSSGSKGRRPARPWWAIHSRIRPSNAVYPASARSPSRLKGRTRSGW